MKLETFVPEGAIVMILPGRCAFTTKKEDRNGILSVECCGKSKDSDNFERAFYTSTRRFLSERGFEGGIVTSQKMKNEAFFESKFTLFGFKRSDDAVTISEFELINVDGKATFVETGKTYQVPIVYNATESNVGIHFNAKLACIPNYGSDVYVPLEFGNRVFTHEGLETINLTFKEIVEGFVNVLLPFNVYYMQSGKFEDIMVGDTSFGKYFKRKFYFIRRDQLLIEDEEGNVCGPTEDANGFSLGSPSLIRDFEVRKEPTKKLERDEISH